ncbi:retrovirus-related pol polyprotein from transposon TNT 1-94 [Tanacetum coccineum]
MTLYYSINSSKLRLSTPGLVLIIRETCDQAEGHRARWTFPFNLTSPDWIVSDKVIKSSVENLVLIPSEFEGIPDSVCDVPLCNNPTPLEAFKEHSETIIDFNDDSTSSDDDSPYSEDIDYVDASPPNAEIVSLEVVENRIVVAVPLPILIIPHSDYEAFYDHIEEKSSEFASELAHIISPPEYDCFYFKSEPDPGELTSIIDLEIHENIYTTNVNVSIEDDQSPLFVFVVWIFLAFLTYPVVPPYLLSTGNEDTIFDPGISIYHSFMPGVSHRSGTFMKFNVYPNHLNESTTSRDLWLSLKKAYAPHSTSREYTLKTQLLRIKMHGDETPDAYLNRAQEYADALAAIGKHVKDKDLVMLVISSLCEEYNGLKTTITTRQSPTAFSELHALLSDHDYMLEKLVHPLHHMVHKPFMVLAHQTTTRVTITTIVAIATLVVTTTEVMIMVVNLIGHPPKIQCMTLAIDVVLVTFHHNALIVTLLLFALGHPLTLQIPVLNPLMLLQIGIQDTGANSHVTPDLEAMDNSDAYYGDDALLVGNGKGLPILHIGSYKVYSPQKTFSLKNILHVPEISHNLLSVQIFCHDNDVFFEFHTSYFVVKDESTHTTLLTGPSPSSPRSPISSPSSVSHLSPTSQTSPESSNGQPSPVSTTSIPPPPPPPLITRQRPANLCQNPKQRVPYNPSANHATVLPTTITEPTSFTIANNSPEWRQAMKEELKRDKNGAITRYKARFVAKGFRQQPDIHNAFLHGNLKEQVYMKQPPGFIDPQRPNHVCFLHKSLYGLKQTPRAWFERLSKALIDLGFKGSKTDPSLFIYSCGNTLLYILVYVDDIIVTGNNKGTIDNIICQLRSAFALKDLGSLNYFLGIEIVPHVSGILLSQKKYILELLQSAGLSNCNLVSYPMVTSSSLSLDDSTAFSNPVKYQQVVVKQILCYLHGTVEHGMLIRRSSGSTLQAFTNVLWKEEVVVAWDDDGGGSMVNGVMAMATVSGDGSEMVRCGGSGRSEWSSGVWRQLWVRQRLAGKGSRKI